jgi:hypothetical protein
MGQCRPMPTSASLRLGRPCMPVRGLRRCAGMFMHSDTLLGGPQDPRNRLGCPARRRAKGGGRGARDDGPLAPDRQGLSARRRRAVGRWLRTDRGFLLGDGGRRAVGSGPAGLSAGRRAAGRLANFLVTSEGPKEWREISIGPSPRVCFCLESSALPVALPRGFASWPHLLASHLRPCLFGFWVDLDKHPGKQRKPTPVGTAFSGVACGTKPRGSAWRGAAGRRWPGAARGSCGGRGAAGTSRCRPGCP